MPDINLTPEDRALDLVGQLQALESIPFLTDFERRWVVLAKGALRRALAAEQLVEQLRKESADQ